MKNTDPIKVPARIEHLRVENYRALKRIELKHLTPVTVLVGPNGSGKSTVFDVFDFLSECFRLGLRHAWERRGSARELKTRGQDGPIIIELKYREKPGTPIITYHLAVDEESGKVFVAEEWLAWQRGKQRGRPFKFLEYHKGVGTTVSGEEPDEKGIRVETRLRSPDLIAVNTLGQFAEHPRAAALREFITDWYVSYLSIDDMRSQPVPGPQRRLSKTGDNLPNVIQYLKDEHSSILDRIFEILRRRVPCIERVLVDSHEDGRLLLQIKDAPFERPILSRFASDGTLKMLAYLTVLYDPELPEFIGIKEPENFLHPRLLPGLAEECRYASECSQVLIATHSPFYLNAFLPHEVFVLNRDKAGYTQTVRASDIPGIPQFMAAGASMGYLWLEGRLGPSDPNIHVPGS
jgi:predicted ATPase